MSGCIEVLSTVSGRWGRWLFALCHRVPASVPNWDRFRVLTIKLPVLQFATSEWPKNVDMTPPVISSQHFQDQLTLPFFFGWTQILTITSLAVYRFFVFIGHDLLSTVELHSRSRISHRRAEHGKSSGGTGRYRISIVPL